MAMVNHGGVKMQLTKIRSLPWCGSLSSKGRQLPSTRNKGQGHSAVLNKEDPLVYKSLGKRSSTMSTGSDRNPSGAEG